MMRSWWMGFLVFWFAIPALSSRLPDSGGSVHVALAEDLEFAFVRAHTTVPLLVREGSPLGWSSELVATIGASEDSRQWVLGAKKRVRLLERSLRRCLDVQYAADSWPASILSTADIQAQIQVTENSVVLDLSQPFGPFKELLLGCVIAGDARGTVMGPYKAFGKDGLSANKEAIVPWPLLDRIVLASGNYGVELKVAEGNVGGERRTMLAPYPDLLLLLQGERALREDPLGFFSNDMKGLQKLYFHLQSDVLVSIYGASRGSEFRGLLPPGLAPSRPISRGGGLEHFVPLRLESDRNLNRKTSLGCEADDALIQGFCGRLAMILRSEQVLAQFSEQDERKNADLRIERWRSPSSDPGLAMLSLLGSFPQLAGELDKSKWLAPLLERELGSRLEAATALERHLLDGYHVVPLVAVDVVFDLAPGLKGVQIREDGVPLLWDAWWVVKPEGNR